MEGPGPLCLECADMDHLVVLPPGDAALTRRAKKASRLSAVVMRFSRSRRRYERQGILVEEEALVLAEQCLADEEARRRRWEREAPRRTATDIEIQAALAGEITRPFPGCPPERAEEIAHYTGTRGSGRIDRSAAGRALDPEAVALAVAASVRHVDTSYDELLMSGVPRPQARERVAPDVHAHSEGRAFYDRKIAEGKTHKEALRALKRRVSDALYARMVHDARQAATAAAEKGPGGQPGNDSVACAAGSHPDTPALRPSHSRTRSQATTTRRSARPSSQRSTSKTARKAS